MFSPTDTIVAIATPPGRGAIGVVRLSGDRATEIIRHLVHEPRDFVARHATLTALHAAASERDVADQVIVTCFPGPASYTGDDVIEISAHGSPVVLSAIVARAVELGARLAAPGEFTLRAFLNGRIDLTQAEAVADLIDAATPAQAQTAFDQLNGTLTKTINDLDEQLFDLIARLEASVDFPDEGYHFVEPGALRSAIDRIIDGTTRLLHDARRGRLLREGLQIAIVGRPNVGKSSLFNALLGSSRAIVTEIPGTTRDMVTEVMDLAGLRVTLVDTAGLRTTDDPIESQGVERSWGAARTADLRLVVCDLSRPAEEAHDDFAGELQGTPSLIVGNKADLPHAWSRPDIGDVIVVSALTGEGLDELRQRIGAALDVESLRDRPAITNLRHVALVRRADEALRRARDAVVDGRAMSEEFVLADLQDAQAAFEEVTGKRSSEDLLEHIFARFCIGK